MWRLAVPVLSAGAVVVAGMRSAARTVAPVRPSGGDEYAAAPPQPP